MRILAVLESLPMRARFLCKYVSPTDHTTTHTRPEGKGTVTQTDVLTVTTVQFEPVFGDMEGGQTSELAKGVLDTNGGRLQLHLTNEKDAASFVEGQEYFLDLTPATK